MMRQILLLSVLVACATDGPHPVSRANERLHSHVEAARVKHQLPGLAAAIVRGDGSIATAVTGVRALGEPGEIQPDDRFHIASCTKSMTAMLAAIAVHRRELEWSSRLVDVVPELAAIHPDFRTATLEQLLAHEARFPAYTQFGPARLEELKALTGTPTEQRLAFLRQVLTNEPANTGTGDAAYSNVGYTAAAAMLERATGMSWETMLVSRLTKPLGMSSVQFGWPATPEDPHQPRGHFRRDGVVVTQPLDDSYMLPPALWPAGAVNASIADMAKYVRDQLDGLSGRNALLPRSSYERLHRRLDRSPSGFTLGWGVRRDEQHGVIHYGAGSGGTFFVRMFIVPERQIALVAAANIGEAAPATRELFDELLKAGQR